MASQGFTIPKALRTPSFHYPVPRNSAGYRPPSNHSKTPFVGTGLKGLKATTPSFPTRTSIKAVHAPSVASGVPASAGTKSSFSYNPKAPSSTSPWDTASAGGQMTAEQMLAVHKIMQQGHQGGSFFDSIKHGAGSILGDALNVISRPNWAVANATNNYLNGGSVVGGLEAGLGGKALNFGQVLAQHHVLDNHTVLRGIAGLGLDVATDPTNALLLAATPLTGGASDALLAEKLAGEFGADTAKAAIAKLAEAPASSTATEALAGMTKHLAPAELDRWNRILSTAVGGAKTLGEKNANELAQLTASVGGRNMVQAGLRGAAEVGDKGLQLKLGLTKGRSLPLTPLSILGHRVAPLAPSLLRTADKLGFLGKVPLLPPIAEHIGTIFKPGWRDPIGHAFDLARRHSGEALAAEHLAHAFHPKHGLLTPTAHKLSNDDMIGALTKAESVKGLVKHHALDEGVLKNLPLSDTQKEFVRQYHQVMERQRMFDAAHNVKYEGEHLGAGPEGQLYVPHNFTRTGMPRSMKGAIKAGFQKKRAGETTLQDILAHHAAGHLTYEPETDAMKLIQHRLTAGGMQQSRGMMQHVMENLYGVPLRVADHGIKEQRVANARAAHMAVAQQAGHLRHSLPVIQREARAARTDTTKELLAKEGARADERIARAQKDLAQHMARKGGLVTAGKKAAAKFAREKEPVTAAVQHLKASQKLVRFSERRVADMETKLHELDAKIAESASSEAHQGLAKSAEKNALRSQEKSIRAHLTQERKTLASLKKEYTKAEAEHGRMVEAAQSAAQSQHTHIHNSFEAAREQVAVERRAEYDRRLKILKKLQSAKSMSKERRLIIRKGYEDLNAYKAETNKLIGVKTRKQLEEFAGKEHPALQRVQAVRDEHLPPAAAKVEATNAHGERLNSLLDRLHTQHAIVEEAQRHLTEHVEAMHLPGRPGRPRLTNTQTLLRQRERALGKLETERAIMHEHHADLANAHAAHEAVAKPTAPRPGIQYFERTRKSLEKQVKDAQMAKQSRLVRTAFRQDKHLDNFEAKLSRDRGRAQQKIRSLQSAAIEASRIAGKDVTRKNPFMHPGLETVDSVSKTHAFPHDIAETLRRVEDFPNHPEEMRKILRTMDTVMSKWKLSVTAVNPGYRIRNSMTDMWNAYISGMPLRLMPVYAARAGRLLSDAKAGDIHATHILMQGQAAGVFSGLFKGDVAKGLAKVAGQSKLRHPLASYVRFAANANSQAENYGRAIHYLYRLDHEKDAVAAARIVRSAHFDYEDLTPIEQKLFKRVAPFYTWTRKNVPYQITQLLSRPGKYSTFSKIGQESEVASGKTKGELLPSFINQGLGFKVPLGKHTYYLPQFGPVDLARIGLAGGSTQSKIQNLAQMLGPQYQLPLAAAFGINAFSGQPIQGTHKLNPANRYISDLLKPLGLGGTTQRKIGGKEVRGPGVNPWVDFLLGQVPAAGAFEKDVANPLKAKQNAPLLRLASYLGGTPLYNVNQKEQQQIALMNFQTKVLPQYIRDLRDSGQFPNAAGTNVSANQKKINKLLLQMMGRR